MFIDARTKGVVLASYDLDQGDKIFICYVSDFGKIEVIGRGVKKSSSRLAPHLEIFTVSDLLIIFGAKNNILRSAFTAENFINLRRNFDLYFAGSYLLELIDKLTPFNDPEPQIFSLLFESLTLLNEAKNKKEIEFIVSRFQFKFLDLLGLRPRFDKCILCGREVVKKNSYFSFKHEGVICDRCPRRETGVLRFTDNSAAALEIIFRKNNGADGKGASIKKETIGDLRKIGSHLVLCHLGKKLRSEPFLAF